MARDFSAKDAKKIIRTHETYIASLKEAKGLSIALRDEVKKAADAYTDNEVLTILNTVSVEELNRDRRGIRVKALTENGFETFGDLRSVSVYDIADVNGISEDTAYTIKRKVDEFSEKIRREIKIRLSLLILEKKRVVHGLGIPQAALMVAKAIINRRNLCQPAQGGKSCRVGRRVFGHQHVARDEDCLRGQCAYLAQQPLIPLPIREAMQVCNHCYIGRKC